MNQTTFKQTKLTTPFGRAAFCALLKPSTKFNPDGDYNAKVILPEGSETDALIATLDAIYEAAYQTELAAQRIDKPKLTDIKRGDKPFKRPVDEDTGEAMPGYVINSRLKRIHRNKAGEITRENPAPTVVDSKGSLMRLAPGQGSIIRIQFLARGFFNPAKGLGVQLQLVGVQVKEFVPIGSVKAEFEELPDGFVETAKASDPVEVMHAPEQGQGTLEAVVQADDQDTDW